jgi:uncharacterized protein YqgV (UPF0045/DUF77 family)
MFFSASFFFNFFLAVYKKSGNILSMKLTLLSVGTDAKTVRNIFLINTKQNKMKTYKIPVSWSVMATMEIEADSLAEAIEKADEASLPTDPEYMDGSFEIIREVISCANQNLSEQDIQDLELSEQDAEYVRQHLQDAQID